MKVVGIRFYEQDKTYDFDPKDTKLKVGDVAIVKTDQGIEAGEVVYLDKELKEEKLIEPIKPVLRKANLSDLEKIKQYSKREKEAAVIFREEVEKYDLPLKLIDVCFAFNGSRITFYFTAETRVDFRSLVKDLTKRFQKSIRLQQIGSRDITKDTGGYGICGRELCCTKFLKEMNSITTEMARLQQISHQRNERISGACGRLLCCLAYEAKFYQEKAKKMPELEASVKTPQGKGRVVSRNFLKEIVEVEFEDQGRVNFKLSEIKWR